MRFNTIEPLLLLLLLLGATTMVSGSCNPPVSVASTAPPALSVSGTASYTAATCPTDAAISGTVSSLMLSDCTIRSIDVKTAGDLVLYMRNVTVTDGVRVKAMSGFTGVNLTLLGCTVLCASSRSCVGVKTTGLALVTNINVTVIDSSIYSVYVADGSPTFGNAIEVDVTEVTTLQRSNILLQNATVCVDHSTVPWLSGVPSHAVGFLVQSGMASDVSIDACTIRVIDSAVTMFPSAHVMATAVGITTPLLFPSPFTAVYAPSAGTTDFFLGVNSSIIFLDRSSVTVDATGVQSELPLRGVGVQHSYAMNTSIILQRGSTVWMAVTSAGPSYANATAVGFFSIAPPGSSTVPIPDSCSSNVFLRDASLNISAFDANPSAYVAAVAGVDAQLASQLGEACRSGTYISNTTLTISGSESMAVRATAYTQPSLSYYTIHITNGSRVTLTAPVDYATTTTTNVILWATEANPLATFPPTTNVGQRTIIDGACILRMTCGDYCFVVSLASDSFASASDAYYYIGGGTDIVMSGYWLVNLINGYLVPNAVGPGPTVVVEDVQLMQTFEAAAIPDGRGMICAVAAMDATWDAAKSDIVSELTVIVRRSHFDQRCSSNYIFQGLPNLRDSLPRFLRGFTVNIQNVTSMMEAMSGNMLISLLPPRLSAASLTISNTTVAVTNVTSSMLCQTQQMIMLATSSCMNTNIFLGAAMINASSSIRVLQSKMLVGVSPGMTAAVKMEVHVVHVESSTALTDVAFLIDGVNATVQGDPVWNVTVPVVEFISLKSLTALIRTSVVINNSALLVRETVIFDTPWFGLFILNPQAVTNASVWVLHSIIAGVAQTQASLVTVVSGATAWYGASSVRVESNTFSVMDMLPSAAAGVNTSLSTRSNSYSGEASFLTLQGAYTLVSISVSVKDAGTVSVINNDLSVVRYSNSVEAIQAIAMSVTVYGGVLSTVAAMQSTMSATYGGNPGAVVLLPGGATTTSPSPAVGVLVSENRIAVRTGGATASGIRTAFQGTGGVVVQDNTVRMDGTDFQSSIIGISATGMSVWSSFRRNDVSIHTISLTPTIGNFIDYFNGLQLSLSQASWIEVRDNNISMELNWSPVRIEVDSILGIGIATGRTRPGYQGLWLEASNNSIMVTTGPGTAITGFKVGLFGSSQALMVVRMTANTINIRHSDHGVLTDSFGVVGIAVVPDVVKNFECGPGWDTAALSSGAASFLTFTDNIVAVNASSVVPNYPMVGVAFWKLHAEPYELPVVFNSTAAGRSSISVRCTSSLYCEAVMMDCVNSTSLSLTAVTIDVASHNATGNTSGVRLSSTFAAGGLLIASSNITAVDTTIVPVNPSSTAIAQKPGPVVHALAIGNSLIGSVSMASNLFSARSVGTMNTYGLRFTYALLGCVHMTDSSIGVLAPVTSTTFAFEDTTVLSDAASNCSAAFPSQPLFSAGVGASVAKWQAAPWNTSRTTVEGVQLRSRPHVLLQRSTLTSNGGAASGVQFVGTQWSEPMPSTGYNVTAGVALIECNLTVVAQGNRSVGILLDAFPVNYSWPIGVPKFEASIVDSRVSAVFTSTEFTTAGVPFGAFRLLAVEVGTDDTPPFPTRAALPSSGTVATDLNVAGCNISVGGTVNGAVWGPGAIGIVDWKLVPSLAASANLSTTLTQAMQAWAASSSLTLLGNALSLLSFPALPQVASWVVLRSTDAWSGAGFLGGPSKAPSLTMVRNMAKGMPVGSAVVLWNETTLTPSSTVGALGGQVNVAWACNRFYSGVAVRPPFPVRELGGGNLTAMTLTTSCATRTASWSPSQGSVSSSPSPTVGTQSVSGGTSSMSSGTKSKNLAKTRTPSTSFTATVSISGSASSTWTQSLSSSTIMTLTRRLPARRRSATLTVRAAAPALPATIPNATLTTTTTTTTADPTGSLLPDTYEGLLGAPTAVQQASATTAVTVGVIGSVMAGSAMAPLLARTIGANAMTSACVAASLNISMGIEDNDKPLQFPLSLLPFFLLGATSRLPYHRGAVVANTVIIPSAVILLVAVVVSIAAAGFHIHAKKKHKQHASSQLTQQLQQQQQQHTPPPQTNNSTDDQDEEKKKQQQHFELLASSYQECWIRAASLLKFPMSLLTVTAIALDGAVASSWTLLMLSSSDGDWGFVVLSGLFSIAVLTGCGLVVRFRPTEFGPTQEEKEANKPPALWHRWLLGVGSWSRDKTSDRGTAFTDEQATWWQSSMAHFGKFIGPGPAEVSNTSRMAHIRVTIAAYFTVCDLLITILNAAIRGIAMSTPRYCMPAAWALLTLNILFLLLLLAIRPFNAIAKNVVTILSNFLLVVASSTLVMLTYQPGNVALIQVTQHVGFAATIVAVIAAMLVMTSTLVPLIQKSCKPKKPPSKKHTQSDGEEAEKQALSGAREQQHLDTAGKAHTALEVPMLGSHGTSAGRVAQDELFSEEEMVALMAIDPLPQPTPGGGPNRRPGQEDLDALLAGGGSRAGDHSVINDDDFLVAASTSAARPRRLVDPFERYNPLQQAPTEPPTYDLWAGTTASNRVGDRLFEPMTVAPQGMSRAAAARTDDPDL